MTEFSTYWQVRTLMMEALWAANEMDHGAPPEIHTRLHRIRTPLHSALKRIDRTMMPDLSWPRLAARA
jgi:hypothetical protein